MQNDNKITKNKILTPLCENRLFSNKKIFTFIFLENTILSALKALVQISNNASH